MPINPSGTRAASFEDILLQLHQLSTDDVAYDTSEIVNLLYSLVEAAKGAPRWTLGLSGASFQWGVPDPPTALIPSFGPWLNRPGGRTRRTPQRGSGQNYVAGRWSLALWS